MAPFSQRENSFFDSNLLIPWLYVSFLALELLKLDFFHLSYAALSPSHYKKEKKNKHLSDIHNSLSKVVADHDILLKVS